jgi:Inner membrane component of T3SS, cytoplasmic domain
MAEIQITHEELRDPAIDDLINLQKSLQPRGGEKIEDVETPFYLNPIFYYSIAAGLGAFIVWAIGEPFYEDVPSRVPFISDYLLFGPVAGVLGLAMGIIYGVVNRNLKQAATGGVVGLGVGLGVTVLTTFLSEMLFGFTIKIALSMMTTRIPDGRFPFSGVSFFIFMCGRGVAWAIVSMGAGLGLGVYLKSKQLTLNGLVGGLIGGLLGGLVFDPLNRFVVPGAGDASLSRGVGIVAVGVFVGLFIGLFENISKEAWFQMLRGPLAGKHFILFKSPMRVGSSPKSDIYLFKDPDIAPLHMTVLKSGNRYTIQDEKSEKGVYVNGRRTDRYVLQPNDTITLGETVLRYHEKQRGS